MTQEQVSEILDRVAMAYASCKSYRDSGESIDLSEGRLSSGTDQTPSFKFSTAFIRPRQFRFEFNFEMRGQAQDSGHNVAWQAGDSAHTWSKGRDEIQIFPNRISALRNSLSEPALSTLVLPHLLNRRKSRSELESRYGATTYGGELEFEGTACYRLEHGAPLDCWSGTERRLVYIEIASHLIRKTEDERVAVVPRMIDFYEGQIKNLEASNDDTADEVNTLETSVEHLRRGESRFFTIANRTTIYQPQLDCEIERETFEFKPPKDSG